MSAVLGVDLSTHAPDRLYPHSGRCERMNSAALDTAWLAGFLDGEGSFQIVRASRGVNYEASLGAGSTILEALERCRALASGSICAVKNPDERWKPSYRWNLRGRHLTPVLEALIPHLTIKREHAEILLVLRLSADIGQRLGRSTLPDSETKWRRTLYQAIGALNIRGSAEPSASQLLALAEVRAYMSHGPAQLTLLREAQ